MAANALSNMLGSIAIACWIVVYSPQYIENYQRQSAEGLSVAFVVVWLLGDITNLLGACLARLLPTVIILALYYTLCDLALLYQIYYYRWKNSRSRVSGAPTPAENTPLLREDMDAPKPLHTARGTSRPVWSASLQHLVSAVFVLTTGIVAWLMSGDVNHGGGADRDAPYPESLEWTIQILGWSSAVLYLGARIPQILKNVKTRCEGLAPALFIWAMLGNTTYALSICAAASTSTDPRYWVTNASWLAGSGLTLILDALILCQMAYFRLRPSSHHSDARRDAEGSTLDSGP